MPFAVVGSNTLIEVCGKKVRGRLYPWGVVEGKACFRNIYTMLKFDPEEVKKIAYSVHFYFFSVENPKHCDFVKLRTMLM